MDNEQKETLSKSFKRLCWPQVNNKKLKNKLNKIIHPHKTRKQCITCP